MVQRALNGRRGRCWFDSGAVEVHLPRSCSDRSGPCLPHGEQPDPDHQRTDRTRVAGGVPERVSPVGNACRRRQGQPRLRHASLRRTGMTPAFEGCKPERIYRREDMSGTVRRGHHESSAEPAGTEPIRASGTPSVIVTGSKSSSRPAITTDSSNGFRPASPAEEAAATGTGR